MEVLQGMTDTLREKKPYLLFEVLPDFLFFTDQELDDSTKQVRNQRHQKIKSLLDSLNYCIFQVQPDQSVTMASTLAAHPRKKFDYIAVPEQEHDLFLSKLTYRLD